jgi:hypothetical protein
MTSVLQTQYSTARIKNSYLDGFYNATSKQLRSHAPSNDYMPNNTSTQFYSSSAKKMRFGLKPLLNTPQVISYKKLITGDKNEENAFIESLQQRGFAVFSDMPDSITKNLKPLQEGLKEAIQTNIKNGWQMVERSLFHGFHNRFFLSLTPELYKQLPPSEFRGSDSFMLYEKTKRFPNVKMAQSGPGYQKSAVEWGINLVNLIARRAKELDLPGAEDLQNAIKSPGSNKVHPFHGTRLLYYPAVSEEKADDIARDTEELNSKLNTLRSDKRFKKKFEIEEPVYTRLPKHYDEDILTLLPPETAAGLEVYDPIVKAWVAPNPNGNENHWVALAGTPLRTISKGTSLEMIPGLHRVVADKKDMKKDRVSFATKIQLHPQGHFVNLATKKPLPHPETGKFVTNVEYLYRVITSPRYENSSELKFPSFKEFSKRFDDFEHSE